MHSEWGIYSSVQFLVKPPPSNKMISIASHNNSNKPIAYRSIYVFHLKIRWCWIGGVWASDHKSVA